MEFLLMNHPLDCPICDQGGECDLQVNENSKLACILFRILTLSNLLDERFLFCLIIDVINKFTRDVLIIVAIPAAKT